MTKQKYYVGSAGPYFYDDADYINDPDGDFAGEFQQAGRTTGTYQADQAPSKGQDMVRLADLSSIDTVIKVTDITNPTELSNYDGDPGTSILAYQEVSGGKNLIILYIFDSSGPAVDNPKIVDAKGTASERWIAIAGDYDVSATFTVITAIQDNAGTIEYKERDLTYDYGRLVTLGAESGWIST